MKMDELNEFSRRFAEYLFLLFPEWKDYASVDTEKGVDAGALIIEIPSPLPERSMHISTDGGEITVAFDMYHSHFGWAEQPESEIFEGAIDYVNEILEERVVIAVSMQEDAWAGSCMLEPGQKPDVVPGQTVYVRSWKGSHDAEYSE